MHTNFLNFYSHYHNILQPLIILASSEVSQALSCAGSQTQGVYFKLSSWSCGPLCTATIGFEEEKKKGLSLWQSFFGGRHGDLLWHFPDKWKPLRKLLSFTFLSSLMSLIYPNVRTLVFNHFFFIKSVLGICFSLTLVSAIYPIDAMDEIETEGVPS